MTSRLEPKYQVLRDHAARSRPDKLTADPGRSQCASVCMHCFVGNDGSHLFLTKCGAGGADVALCRHLCSLATVRIAEAPLQGAVLLCVCMRTRVECARVCVTRAWGSIARDGYMEQEARKQVASNRSMKPAIFSLLRREIDIVLFRYVRYEHAISRGTTTQTADLSHVQTRTLSRALSHTEPEGLCMCVCLCVCVLGEV